MVDKELIFLILTLWIWICSETALNLFFEIHKSCGWDTFIFIWGFAPIFIWSFRAYAGLLPSIRMLPFTICIKPDSQENFHDFPWLEVTKKVNDTTSRNTNSYIRT